MTEKNLHRPGVKNDTGKPRAGLVLKDFSRALMAVSEVGTFGAEKYTERGWVTVENGVERYTDAMVRHLLDEAQGQVFDDESELAHSAHAAWNALARLELTLRQATAKADPLQEVVPGKQCQSCAHEFSEALVKPCNQCSYQYLNLWSPKA